MPPTSLARISPPLLALVCLSAPTLAQPPNIGLAELADRAVAIWDFSDPAAGILRDISGNAHHGRLVGATWVEGPWGNALRFRRAQRNYVSVADTPALHVQPPYSFGVWFRTTSSQNNAVYLLKNGGTFTGCGLYYYGDSMAMYVDAKGVDIV